VEVLRAPSGVARYQQVMDEVGNDPRQRVLAVFDELEKITTTAPFRGCRYTSAELALADPAHPAPAEIPAYKDALHRLFTGVLTRDGHPDPEFGADQLLVLIDGTLAYAVTRILRAPQLFQAGPSRSHRLPAMSRNTATRP
jgi:hypothetical protein